MIKYTTKEIIARAEQLADLQNSDFISDWEKQSLLNEAWLEMYQKMIAANDHTFTRTLTVDGDFCLPSDFYQLQSVFLKDGRTQVPRRNPSEGVGYDIHGNMLTFTDNYQGKEITVEYFPAPLTLFYKGEKKTRQDFPASPLLYIEQGAFIDEDRVLWIENTATEHVVPDGAYMFKNGYISQGRLYSYDGEEMDSSEVFAVENDRVTYDAVRGDIPEGACILLTDPSREQRYWITAEGKLLDMNGNELADAPTGTPIMCRQDGLYYRSGSVFVRWLGNVKETFNEGLYKSLCFIDSVDAVFGFSGNYYSSGYGFNTHLEWPSNIYFTLLAYSLAVSFRLKQNGDVQNLSVKLQDAWDQFYNAIDRDANDSYRIKNMYGRGNTWF